MKKISIYITIFLSIVFINALCYAQATTNISKRIGLGINNNLSPLNSDYPNTQISIRYWLDELKGFEATFGFSFENNTYNYENSTKYDPLSFTLGGKFLYTLRKQENSSLYLAPITALTYYDYDDSGIGLLIGCMAGTEFFFDRLPHLRFNLEAGIAYKNIDDKSSFSIIGGRLGWAGFHYYL